MPAGRTIHSGEVAGLAAELAAPDGPRAVLLAGSPGVGTTTTLDALAAAVAGPAARVHRVGADETSGERPFGVAAALIGVDVGYPPIAGFSARLVEALEQRCHDGPLVLVADDLHHADPDSLRMLAAATDLTRDLPLTLLLARRPLPPRERLAALAARPDVLAAEVTGLDDAGIATVVRNRVGADPGPTLRAALRAAGGNPLYVTVLLTDLARRGALRVGTTAEVDGTVALPDSLSAAARAQLALLDPPTRHLLQVLAVWGAAAAVEDLAAVLDAPPATLLGPVQSAVGAGIATWTTRPGDPAPAELLGLRHEVHREVLLADLDPPLRRVLAAACAAVLRTPARPEPALDEGSTPAGRALRVARTELSEAPARAADLLAGVADRATGDEADEVAIARAQALAGAGQTRESARVAGERLAVTTEPRARAALMRATLHALLDAADTAGVFALLERAREAPLAPGQRATLDRVEHLTRVLGGRGTVPEEPAGPSAIGTVLELYLRARCVDALAAADAAVAAGPPELAADENPPTWADPTSTTIWPALLSLFAEGPDAARERSLRARREAQEQGRLWLTPSLLFVAGAVDVIAGRWDDALATHDAGLEAAEASGSGWGSRSAGHSIGILVRRGELDAAATALTRWRAHGLPEQLGLPQVALAETLLEEARGNLDAAAAIASRSWAATLDTGRRVWALASGPDVVRVALQAGHGALAARVVAETAAVPTDQTPTLAPAVDLVRAVADGDPDRAGAAAASYAARGNVLGELGAWEEAAVAAAAGGESDRAREYAARCGRLAGSLGARTVERRLAARLRAHDVRSAPPRRADRPTSGWGSLTRTELAVAELVGQGLTSPQIATRMYLSPRTVQTHISHTLRKLDLRTRSELAATVTRQAQLG